MEVCFEVHTLEQMIADFGPDVEGWLNDPFAKTCVPTVYLLPEVAKDFPACKPYPMDEAAALMGGRTYFTSSFSYMLAMALLQDDVTEIGIWGVDLADGTEYTEQRPCAEFLIGMAMGRGIKVTIPERSALLKTAWVYGLEPAPGDNPLVRQWTDKAADYRAKARQLLIDLPQQIAALEGAAHECDEAAKDLLNQARGG